MRCNFYVHLTFYFPLSHRHTHTHTNTRIHIERIDRNSLAHRHADTILIAYRPFAAAAQQLLCNAHEKSFKEDIDPSISRR